MKLLVLGLCMVLAVEAGTIDEWHQFKRKYNKEYANGDEEQHRMNVFFANQEKINEHNTKFAKGLTTYTVKVNHLADLTAMEVKAIYNGYNRSGIPTNGPSMGGTMYEKPVGIQVPDTMDWSKKGAVTPVKNQGQCGSCWAFSTTGSLEGQHFLKTKKLVSLSEQNLVDCSGKYGNLGCGGGLMDYAFAYIKDNKGIDTEDSYPYEAMDDNCKFSTSSVGATDKGFVDIESGDEDALKTAAATIGPISVAIDASNWSFQMYSGGIYNEKNCKNGPNDLDHGVLVVGYGSENGQDYWLVKNSWGADWGMAGYIKMARNNNNMCGVATQASYPTV